jgi:hypothetical protein
MPATIDLSLDARVLAFNAAVSLLTALAFGLAPAWRASGADVLSVFRTAGVSPAVSACPVDWWWPQTALSVVLLVGTGLFLKSVNYGQSMDVGMDTRLVVMSCKAIHGPGARVPTPAPGTGSADPWRSTNSMACGRPILRPSPPRR